MNNKTRYRGKGYDGFLIYLYGNEFKSNLLSVINKRLKKSEAFVIVRYFIDGHTQSEIGKELGVGRNWPMYLLNRAVRKLRSCDSMLGLFAGEIVRSIKEEYGVVKGVGDVLPRLDCNIPINKIYLSTRARRVLKNMGIKTIDALSNYPVNKLLKERNCGWHTVREIYNVMLKLI